MIMESDLPSVYPAASTIMLITLRIFGYKNYKNYARKRGSNRMWYLKIKLITSTKYSTFLFVTFITGYLVNVSKIIHFLHVAFDVLLLK